MKNELVLISLGVAMFGILAIAGNLTKIPTEAGVAKIKEVVNDNVDIVNGETTGTTTQNNVSVTGTLTVTSIPLITGGWSGTITNICASSTNIIRYYQGIVTNVTLSP